MLFLILEGVMLFFLLYSFCFFRLLFVSFRALSIEPVVLSAYKITFPSTFLAALPIVCISEVSDLRKPSLSASRIATREHSGISKPSLRRFIPTRTSNTPVLKSLRISILSSVSISE